MFYPTQRKIIQLANHQLPSICICQIFDNCWANKQKLIAYWSFPTNLKSNPFHVEWCMKHSERNAMQKCCNGAVWFVWIPHNIRILIEHNWILFGENSMLPKHWKFLMKIPTLKIYIKAFSRKPLHYVDFIIHCSNSLKIHFQILNELSKFTLYSFGTHEHWLNSNSLIILCSTDSNGNFVMRLCITMTTYRMPATNLNLYIAVSELCGKRAN